MQEDEIVSKHISQCNNLINYFLGSSSLQMYTPNYHNDWNVLMRACHAWDNIDRSLFNIDDSFAYPRLSDILNNTVTKYEIEPVWERIVTNLVWYFK
jgi:hypothetical protein